jgi:ATP-dependent DNA ligase
LVHEVKHDGYRMIVRRDGRNANDWTARLAAIAAAAEQIKAKSFRARRLCSGLTACQSLK